MEPDLQTSRRSGPTRSALSIVMNKVRVHVLLLACLCVLASCAIYSQKEFSLHPPDPDKRWQSEVSLDLNGFRCSIRIDAKPRWLDEWNRSDSTYYVALSIGRSPCTSAWRDRYDSMSLVQFAISGAGRLQPNVVSAERPSPCHYHFVFDPVVLSDTIDTIYVDLTLSEMTDDGLLLMDTTVALYRIQWRRLGLIMN